MRSAWPSAPARDALGTAPDRHQPARKPCQEPAGGVQLPRQPPPTPPRRTDQPRMPRSTGAQPPTRPAPPRSAALRLPSAAHRRSDQPPNRPPPRPRGRFADRPAGCRVAHRRSPRLWPSTQGPPAPHPATLAQFPPAHQARGPIAAHTIDGFSDFGFWVLVLNWDFGIEIRGLGDHAEVSRVSVVTPKSTLCVRTRILPLRLL